MAAWCIRRCNVADLPKKIDKQVSDKYKIEKNTISRSVKEDYKDKIEIEIGDSKQEDFKPQVKIMRWDNEVNFSLRAEEHPNATVEITDNVFKYKTPDYEVHQYELDPSDIGEDGGLEFEWVLPHRPLTNTLTATIQTKGLDFFYQPALTPEEIEQGAERPENVVGSYAVYHKEKGGMNRSDGKEYKTGKAFHIYRPKCKDANGNETWGELNIDTNSGILTVTVDNDWLDSAVYPVIVDPTFGYTTLGGSGSVINGETFIVRKSSKLFYNIVGSLDSITFGLSRQTNASETVYLYINENNSGGANIHGETVSYSSSHSLTATRSWFTSNASSQSLNGNYWVNLHVDLAPSGTNQVSMAFDSGSTQVGSLSEIFADLASAQEDPWTETLGTESLWSIYANFTGDGSLAILNAFKTAVANSAKTSLTISSLNNVSSDFLLVTTHVECLVGNAANMPVTGITFNGDALTKIRHDEEGNGRNRTEMWYRVAPDIASGSVVISLTGEVDGVIGCAYLFSGVHQTTPIDANTGETDTVSDTSIEKAITTTVANCTIVYGLTTGSASVTHSTSTGETEIYDLDASTVVSGSGGIRYVTTATSYTVTAATSSADDRKALTLVAISPANTGGGSSTPKTMLLMGIG